MLFRHNFEFRDTCILQYCFLMFPWRHSTRLHLFTCCSRIPPWYRFRFFTWLPFHSLEITQSWENKCSIVLRLADNVTSMSWPNSFWRREEWRQKCYNGDVSLHNLFPIESFHRYQIRGGRVKCFGTFLGFWKNDLSIWQQFTKE